MQPLSAKQVMFVLVHGGHAGAWVWDEVRPHLRLPSLAVDLPGHGQRPGNLRSLSMAECVRSIQSELPKEPRLILVGHSLGAAVVLALAEELRERVAHLVVVAGPVPRPGTSITGAFPFFMRLASRLVLWCSGEEFSQSARMAEQRYLNGVSPERVRLACSRFTKESRSLVLEPLHWSGRPPEPCTYIHCLRDRGPLSPKYQEVMAANLGSEVRLVSLDTCHYPMLEQPELMARVLNEAVQKEQ
ncbi:MAG: alpha/beta hydrolase family protein [Verrucomicrobiales bacterium]|nr:alpha/beta hydrolase family protein [Verrucomicrobiales bacterium]